MPECELHSLPYKQFTYLRDTLVFQIHQGGSPSTCSQDHLVGLVFGSIDCLDPDTCRSISLEKWSLESSGPTGEHGYLATSWTGVPPKTELHTSLLQVLSNTVDCLCGSKPSPIFTPYRFPTLSVSYVHHRQSPIDDDSP